MLIVRAEVAGIVRDVRIRNGGITEIGERLRRLRDEDVVDARGGALIPGLHDHHLHVRALAAATASVHVGPPAVRDPQALAQRLRSATPRAGWVRAVGYHDSVAGPLDARTLDAILPGVPLRVQHRSGAMWILNSAAMATTVLDAVDDPGVERDESGRPNGRLFRMDGWLRGAVPPTELDLGAIGAIAASRGVTGLTDATPAETAEDVADLVAARVSGALPQRLMLMAADVPEEPGVETGPLKIVIDEIRLPVLEELAARITATHAHGRPVAIHCLTRTEVIFALAALELARPHPGDRLEHAASTPPEMVEVMRRLGVTIVTQPNFVTERGDAYRADVPAGELGDLYRLRSLIDAGIPVAAGTDAPLGCADPWAAMAAACSRRTPDGAVLGDVERLAAVEALDLFLGHSDRPGVPRRVGVGTSDVVLLRCPLDDALAHPTADNVSLTIAGGRVVFPTS